MMMNKLHEPQVCEDILSYLPDGVRSHIVSFLPMKDAFRTTILSTRWKLICSSLSVLKFCFYLFNNSLEFRDVIDRTLILHDGSDLRKFSIWFQLDDDILTSDHVNTWITFAIRHKVQHLTLHFGFSDLERLPGCLFTNSTLSILNLVSCDTLNWPKIICFPMLKRLKVEGLTFYDEEVTTMLFSSSACPVLEVLTINSCNFQWFNALSISFPSLKIFELQYEIVPAIVVNLSIPIVRKIIYRCGVPINISCETISSIFDARLQCYGIDSIEEQHVFRNLARKFLASLNNVCTLSLSSEIIEILATDPDLLAHLPASFCNLKHIHVNITSVKHHVEVLACLVKTAPNLQSLYLCFEMDDMQYLDGLQLQEYWQLNELSIANSLKHLRSVQIVEFKGRASELEILKRLLESASALENISISYESDVGDDIQFRMGISEILLSFKRVSPHATILFQ